MLYLCSVKSVRYNKYHYKENRLCLVVDWFLPRNHNHDYVSNIVKSNKIKVTKIMPKEETLYLFRMSGCRLQLVEMYTLPKFRYQVRENRIVKLNTYSKFQAISCFSSIAQTYMRQLSFNFTI